MSKRIDVLPRRDGESLTDWTLRFLADGRQRLQTAQEVHKPCGCKVSTGICGCLTYGTGGLDWNGFWSVPCPHGSEKHTCFDPVQRECTCENNGDYCPKCERERGNATHRHGNTMYENDDCAICAKVMRKDSDTQLLRLAEDADRRRLDDLYRACTPVEAEFAEGEE